MHRLILGAPPGLTRHAAQTPQRRRPHAAASAVTTLAAALALALAVAPTPGWAAAPPAAPTRTHAAAAATATATKAAATQARATTSGPAAPARAAAASASACPQAQAPVLEHFTHADCADCWAGRVPGSGSGGWRFDWILPSGADAPLAAGALRDATDRAQRIGLPTLLAPGQRTQPWPAEHNAAPPAWRLQVRAGPAWAGYVGLQLQLLWPARGQPTLPAGSSAWLALVELLPAGSEGSLAPRALVRSVAGPLPLTGLQPGVPWSQLRAMRWPEGAQPTRLQARAWLEAPNGRLLAVAADPCGLP